MNLPIYPLIPYKPTLCICFVVVVFLFFLLLLFFFLLTFPLFSFAVITNVIYAINLIIYVYYVYVQSQLENNILLKITPHRKYYHLENNTFRSFRKYQ